MSGSVCRSDLVDLSRSSRHNPTPRSRRHLQVLPYFPIGARGDLAHGRTRREITGIILCCGQSSRQRQAEANLHGRGFRDALAARLPYPRDRAAHRRSKQWRLDARFSPGHRLHRRGWRDSNGHFAFLVAPSWLVFSEVAGLRIAVEWKHEAVGGEVAPTALHPAAISQLVRRQIQSPSYDDRPLYEWSLELHWPVGGMITFCATSFTLRRGRSQWRRTRANICRRRSGATSNRGGPRLCASILDTPRVADRRNRLPPNVPSRAVPE